MHDEVAVACCLRPDGLTESNRIGCGQPLAEVADAVRQGFEGEEASQGLPWGRKPGSL
jgi:hypothetical protein